MISFVQVILLEDNDRIFLNISKRAPVDIESSIKRGDWVHTDDILDKGAEWIISEVKLSGLRGRGGAGFPTGTKWSFMPQKKVTGKSSYLIINGDESEPGTCKDRDILRFEPHKIVEGAVIAACAMKIDQVFIYVRGEFYNEAKVLENAIQEAYDKNFIKNTKITLHRGAGAYICGEETALMESLEGKKGMPRMKPPFPAGIGLYASPTTINNIETIASIPVILKRGAKWFSSMGVTNSSGTKIFCISGHVNNPVNVEEKLGVSLKTLIEGYAGGVIGGWENLLAVIPGGSSVPLLPKSICDTITMDFDALKSVKSGLGTGGIIVMNKSTDIIMAIERLSHFYMHESCGQCTPCREGTGWLWRMMKKLVTGNAKISDIDKMLSVASQIEGHTICALGDAAAWPVQGLVRHFRKEIEDRIRSFSN